MKKLIILLVSLLFFVWQINAQTWDSLGAGITAGNKTYNYVEAMTEYNGNLYAGGDFGTTGNITTSCVGLWNGLGWDSVAHGVVGEQGGGFGIYSEVVYNGNLFAGGNIDSAGGKAISGIAQWNGIKWDSVGLGIGYYVVALSVYNGNLFAGGYILDAGGKSIYGIAQWNGTNWDSVSSGTHGGIYALAVYNGDLYAGGSFDNIGHIIAKNIAKWNGINWSPVGLGIDSTVNSLAVYNGNLYAGGIFKNAGGIPAKNIATWNGANWNSVGGGVSGILSYTGIYALTQYGSILCAGGSFDSAGNQSANNIAYWNGISWSPIGSGIQGSTNNTFVLSLYSTSSILYVGGTFDSAGGIAANNIAQLSGPLGINSINDMSGEVSIFPNPSNGQFTLSVSNVTEKFNVEIYNVMGEKMYTTCLPQTPKGALIAVNLSGQPSGVYLYRVIKEDGEILGSGKFVIAP